MAQSHAPSARLALTFPREFLTVLCSARLAWDDATDLLPRGFLWTPLYASIYQLPRSVLLIILLLFESKLFRNNS